MIGKIIRLGLVLVFGILVYNFFLGDPSEKENARKIFGEIKEVGVAVKDLVKSEKQKFDEGKYDEALDKVGNVFQKLKRQAKDIDEKYIDKIADLEETRLQLEERLAALNKEVEAMPEEYKDNSEFAATEKKLDRERDKLTNELDDLVKAMDKLTNEMSRE